MMEISDLSFQLNIYGEDSYEDFVRFFRDEFLDLNINWWASEVVGATHSNWVELGYEYDNPTTRHLAYLTILVASKRNTSPTEHDLQEQLSFARRLIAGLKSRGSDVEFNGFFEEHL